MLDALVPRGIEMLEAEPTTRKRRLFSAYLRPVRFRDGTCRVSGPLKIRMGPPRRTQTPPPPGTDGFETPRPLGGLSPTCPPRSRNHPLPRHLTAAHAARLVPHQQSLSVIVLLRVGFGLS